MMSLCSEVIAALRLEGLTLATGESLTGGGIGAALTAVPGASDVFKGGIITYTDQIKNKILNVPQQVLDRFGAVSEQTAAAMAAGAREVLSADVAVSVTGLAGPGGDGYGHRVGTVYIGYADAAGTAVVVYHFDGSREDVRRQTIWAALRLILDNISVRK